MSSLHRFWFTFTNPPQFSPLGLGCGVTAHNSEDAMTILRTQVFDSGAELKIEASIEDVDVQALDSHHVLPNMGDVTRRGVWFPLSYQSTSR
jgi:hypothetical protein